MKASQFTSINRAEHISHRRFLHFRMACLNSGNDFVTTISRKTTGTAETTRQDTSSIESIPTSQW